MEEGTQV